jgi:hypothetical protein
MRSTATYTRHSPLATLALHSVSHLEERLNINGGLEKCLIVGCFYST